MYEFCLVTRYPHFCIIMRQPDGSEVEHTELRESDTEQAKVGWYFVACSLPRWSKLDPLLGSVVERERFNSFFSFWDWFRIARCCCCAFLVIVGGRETPTRADLDWRWCQNSSALSSSRMWYVWSGLHYFGRFSFCRQLIHVTVTWFGVRIWLRFTIHHSIHSCSWRFRCSYGDVRRNILTIDSAGIRAVYAGTGCVCVWHLEL